MLKAITGSRALAINMSHSNIGHLESGLPNALRYGHKSSLFMPFHCWLWKVTSRQLDQCSLYCCVLLAIFNTLIAACGETYIVVMSGCGTEWLCGGTFGWKVIQHWSTTWCRFQPSESHYFQWILLQLSICMTGSRQGDVGSFALATRVHSFSRSSSHTLWFLLKRGGVGEITGYEGNISNPSPPFCLSTK